MARPKDDDLQKHTLNLFRGDYEKIQALFPDVGAGPIIRRILRRFIEKTEMGEVSTDPNVEVNL